jgi:phosphatidylserine/phosphatidylglycerophosphate/cardiolipin synthase-like enzyme
VYRVVAVVLLGCVCLSAGLATGTTAEAEPAIVGLYPNPAADGDEGEFVTLSVPPGTNLSEYRLADEQRSVRLESPSTAESGSVVTFSTDPQRTATLVDQPVSAIADGIRLANGGERVRLIHNGSVVDVVTYGRAPDGETYDASSDSWKPLGNTQRPVISDAGGTVEAFVLPDEPDRAVAFLENASERILLAGYTVTSERVVEALVAAHKRGVEVDVLAEGSPVGGLTEDGAAAFDALADAGISVRVFAGEPARYRYHHAKYAVVDGRALVTTENWKPAGTGGRDSRGWAVITRQRDIVAGLVETFRADAGWVDTKRWEVVDKDTVSDDEPLPPDFPRNFEAAQLPVNRTRLLVAPDNAEQSLVRAIDAAEESLDIKQVRISDRAVPLLRATLRAATRGVRVRILLSGAWYVESENRQMKRWLEEQASAGDLPLSVRIATPEGRFGKIHAKGLIVDGQQTFVGSVNWGNNSLRNNREVGLLLDGAAVGEYFGTVFESDWRREDSQLPVGYVAACLVAAVTALAVGKRIEFEG